MVEGTPEGESPSQLPGELTSEERAQLGADQAVMQAEREKIDPEKTRQIANLVEQAVSIKRQNEAVEAARKIGLSPDSIRALEGSRSEAAVKESEALVKAMQQSEELITQALKERQASISFDSFDTQGVKLEAMLKSRLYSDPEGKIPIIPGLTMRRESIPAEERKGFKPEKNPAQEIIRLQYYPTE
jgi:hypothetical protein